MTFAYDGQLVLAPWRGGWVKAVVATAAGNLARCVNELHGIDEWFKVDDLRPCES